MRRSSSATCASVAVFSMAAWAASISASARAQSVEQALGYKPIQRGVAIEIPPKDQFDKCKIDEEKDAKTGKPIGFVVTGPAGNVLRRFVDSDGDKKLDMWSYFRDGIEVYRDIGSPPAKKTDPVVADQFRWLGPNGTRWGRDTDGDETIDLWLEISVEEVSMEFVEAIREKSEKRFAALLLTSAEIDRLTIDAELKAKLKEQTAKAKTAFAKYADKQKTIDKETTWISFGGAKPATYALSDSLEVTIYENTSAIVANAGDEKGASDVAMGTLVRVRDGKIDAWRMIELPEDPKSVFRFVNTPSRSIPEAGEGEPTAEENAAIGKIRQDIAKIENSAGAKPLTHAEWVKLFDLSERAIDEAQSAEQADEARFFAQRLFDSVQADTDVKTKKEAMSRFTKLRAAIEAKKLETAAGFAAFREIHSRYFTSLASLGNAPDGEQVESIHEELIDSLKKFVEGFPNADDRQQALLDLGQNFEQASRAKEAIEWYEKAAEVDPQSLVGRKADGAATRLGLKGKSFALKGTTLDNKTFDIASLKGKTVVVYYFAAGNPQWPQEVKQLADIEAAGKKQVQVIGVALDSQKSAAIKGAKDGAFRWPVLYDKGGEGDLAVQYGVLQTPHIIIVDKEGKVRWQGITADGAAANIPK